MRKKRKSIGFIAFAVFVVFIIVSGFALKAADYIDNPFDDIAFTSQWVNGGEQQLADTLGQNSDLPPLTTTANSAEGGIDLTSLSESDAQFELPPVNTVTDGSADTGTNFDGTDRENRIVWSDIGGVFYDLWFICATTACFIAVQYVFKFSIKQFKSYLPAAAAAK